MTPDTTPAEALEMGPDGPIPEEWKPGMALASALMAAGYAGDSGEDVDRLIAELAKRGYALARAVPGEGEGLDAAWEALRDALWDEAPSYDPENIIMVHRPRIEAALRAERPGVDVDVLHAALEPRKRDWIDCECQGAHNIDYAMVARLMAERGTERPERRVGPEDRRTGMGYDLPNLRERRWQHRRKGDYERRVLRAERGTER